MPKDATTSDENTQTENPVPLTQKPSSKLQALAYISILCATCATFYCIWLLMPESSNLKSSSGLSSVKWLPMTASDISFAKGKHIEACEFLMEKEDFLQWAKPFHPQELQGEMKLARFTFLQKLERDPLFSTTLTPEEEKEHFAFVSTGYLCIHKEKNIRTRILYDSGKQRVYMHRSTLISNSKKAQ